MPPPEPPPKREWRMRETAVKLVYFVLDLAIHIVLLRIAD